MESAAGAAKPMHNITRDALDPVYSCGLHSVILNGYCLSSLLIRSRAGRGKGEGLSVAVPYVYLASDVQACPSPLCFILLGNIQPVT